MLRLKKIMKIKNDCWRNNFLFWTEGDTEFYFDVYRYYNGSLEHLNKAYFSCGADVGTKTDYWVSLFTLPPNASQSNYLAISLHLKEDDSAFLLSDDVVETEWWYPDWPFNARSKPTLNLFPFTNRDTDR